MVNEEKNMKYTDKIDENLIEESYHDALIAEAKEVFAKFIEICPSKRITEEDLKDWDAYED